MKLAWELAKKNRKVIFLLEQDICIGSRGRMHFFMSSFREDPCVSVPLSLSSSFDTSLGLYFCCSFPENTGKMLGFLPLV